MSEKINKTQVLDRIKGYYKLKSNAKLASFLEVAPTTVSSWYSRATFDIDILYSKCVDLSFDWLLTGEGPMLRGSKASEESTMDHSPEKVQSTSSDIVTLRLMDKLDEKDSIIKDKEAKIDQLQAELRHQSAELAALKAQAQHLHGHGYRDHSDNEGSHPGLGQ